MISIAPGNKVNRKPAHEVVQARCEHVISRAGDGVREGCDHRDEQEEKRSGRHWRRSPPRANRLVPHPPGRPQRPLEPHEIEDSQALKYGRDQNPHATAVVEVCQCVGDGAGEVMFRNSDI
jgi:hypothetical protein